MFKKAAYSLIVFLFLLSNAKSQINSARTNYCCSNVVEDLSEGWKKDSLANNGYREKNVKFLYTCKFDTLSAYFLLERFGKPSRINNTNHSIEYVYFYYDYRTKPKGFDGPLAAAGIIFHFQEKQKMLLKISETDIDL